MNIHHIGAVDIGSNAIRLLICQVIEDGETTHFRKQSLIRVPLRLGKDVFLTGVVSEKNVEHLVDACVAFAHLLRAYQVSSYRACATSAMREATNAPAILKKIRSDSGLEVEVISGEEEASIIYSTHIERLLDADRPSLYVDIGGGSTEITVFQGRDVKASTSFNIGTVRMLEGQVDKAMMGYIKTWLQKNCAGMKGIQTIGSGGTINKLSKLVPNKKKDTTFYSYGQLKNVYAFLKALTFEERIVKAGLNADRADVILPAAQIMLTIMKWAGSKSIMIPKFGLADGMVRSLYEAQVQAEK
ncbi:MAG: exopolyphosphatase [Flavobacteriales bacterium]|nr:exopolyphosphatase [Flavobacteriales bacterium]